MLGAVTGLLVMLAQASAASTQTPGATSPAPPAANAATASQPAAPACGTPSENSRTIVICGERDQGYRLNPDVMEAKKELKNPGPLRRPSVPITPPCGTVGPQPCQYGGISLIGVALTAAEMAKRAAEGKEIGSMFQTDPHPSEYQLYQMAKARREQREAEEAAQKAAAKVKADAVKATKAEAAAPKPATPAQ